MGDVNFGVALLDNKLLWFFKDLFELALSFKHLCFANFASEPLPFWVIGYINLLFLAIYDYVVN